MGKKRVLLIDDNSRVLETVKQILSEAGYEVQITKNSEMAEQLALEFQPDLAVLDIMMPEMDGFETALSLAQNPALAKMPFVFLSVRGEDELRARAKELGAAAYLDKPVKKDELLQTVDRVLSGKGR